MAFRIVVIVVVYFQLLLLSIVDEPVFGCDLKTLCNREGQIIPKVIQCCVAAIEENNLDTDGLYRICGNLSEVQKMRFQINHGEFIVFLHGLLLWCILC